MTRESPVEGAGVGTGDGAGVADGGFDTDRAHPARVYNSWLVGGKDNSRRVDASPVNAAAWALTARLGCPDLAERIGLHGDLLLAGVTTDAWPSDVPLPVIEAARRAGLFTQPAPHPHHRSRRGNLPDAGGPGMNDGRIPSPRRPLPPQSRSGAPLGRAAAPGLDRALLAHRTTGSHPCAARRPPLQPARWDCDLLRRVLAGLRGLS